ncbi:MAG: hypothetical protein ACI9VR_001768 [Cognaticolwellia sp.]|jgi:hypothetical protein
MSLEALLLCSAGEVTSFRATLQAQGLRLYEAETFQDAKALVQRHRLRLALTTDSPSHTQLKALPQLDLVLMGRDDPETARRRLRAGAADWLSLPLRASDVQRMLSFHRRRRDIGQSTEFLSASVLVDALNRALKTQASEQVLRQVVRAGRVLTRDDLNPGNTIAAVQAAVSLAQAATNLHVGVQTDPALRPTRLGTAKTARAVLHLLMSGAQQGATMASVSAIELQDHIQIEVYSDIPVRLGNAFSTGPVHRIVGSVGGRLELTSTTGSGLQIQLSLPLAET